MKFDAQSASRAVLIETMQTLGAFRNELVVVGGSVPELLYPDIGHIGTLDVDLAISPAALGQNVYETILKRLVDAGYTHKSDPMRFLRKVDGVDDPVKVDLISGEYQSGGKAAAIQVDELKINALRGLDLAFENSKEIKVSGLMPDGSQNTVRVRIVKPEAYILIKAFALDERNKQKDAYDIIFVLRNHEPNVEALAELLRPLLKNGLAQEGYEILKAKFDSIDSIGPRWAANVYTESGENFAQAQRTSFEYATTLFAATDR